MVEILAILLAIAVFSLVFSICFGVLKFVVWLICLPITVGWWLITLPFKILFG